QRELRADVVADARGGGRRVSVKRDVRKTRSQLPELPVLGPEVVAPLADAVRLVDGDEAEVAARQPRLKTVAAFADEPLRRNVQQPVSPITHAGRYRAAFLGRLRAVEKCRRYAVADERVHLILHE